MFSPQVPTVNTRSGHIGYLSWSFKTSQTSLQEEEVTCSDYKWNSRRLLGELMTTFSSLCCIFYYSPVLQLLQIFKLLSLCALSGFSLLETTSGLMGQISYWYQQNHELQQTSCDVFHVSCLRALQQKPRSHNLNVANITQCYDLFLCCPIRMRHIMGCWMNEVHNEQSSE